VDLDVPPMLRVLRTPFEKISDTVREGYARSLGISLEHGEFSGRVAATREEIETRERVGLPGVPTAALVRVVTLAVEAARRQEQSAVAKGCFVDTVAEGKRS
jgi:hypothetical protein